MSEKEMELKGLELLRKPFSPELISKLPKPTIKNEEYRKLPKAKCNVCNGYHATSNTIHLDYVGHAALTDRLLDADPLWYWEPLSLDDRGLPAFDKTGGLWIRLFVCGHSRIGYGNAKENPYADIGSREKEVIGDALRNAAMRFGAALDLWHKGDLHAIDDTRDATNTTKKKQAKSKPYTTISVDQATYITDLIVEAKLTEDQEKKMLSWDKLSRKVDSVSMISEDDYDTVVQFLGTKIHETDK